MKTDTKNKGIYSALIDQLDKLARHNRQGSFRTKDRYYEAMKRFCRYLAHEYRLQKLANVSGKHLVSYVEEMQMTGKAASTIKTDLAAIRFFHDLMDAKYHLPDNDELGVALERRRFGQVDRTWTPPEFNRLLATALREDCYDYILAFYLARYAGLHIHECFRIDTAIAENALRSNAITIKGKGGKVRTVPINDAIAVALRKQLSRTERGHKLLVPDDMPTDDAIYRVQKFLLDHRKELQDEGDSRPLTFHSLRHTYAAEKYQKLVEGGMPALQYAMQLDIIDRNPADRVILPKKQHKQVGSVYSAEEIYQLIEFFRGDVLETLIRLTATYGLRRSEICGLRWEAVDFQEGTISINHTAVSSRKGVIYADATKSRSSCRTLPLTNSMKDYLMEVREKQRQEKEFLGPAYVDSGYVCVAADGTPLTPNVVSMHFRRMIRKSGLPYIRFHDLRHSVATLLHSVGRDIQDIQGWLGHSDISTTANIYSHFLYSAKRDMADSIEAALSEKTGKPAC